jgi:hypothetical protein
MTSNREKRIRETLFSLLDTFQKDGDSLSRDTEAAIVQTLESLRWDYLRLLPDSPLWEELEGRFAQLSRPQRRRFEYMVRELLLRRTA